MSEINQTQTQLTDPTVGAIVEDIILRKQSNGSENLYTIKYQMINLSIIEDINESILAGSLLFIDTERLYENCPFLGNDFITIKIKNQRLDEFINVEFKVTNYELKKSPDDLSYIVMLEIRSANYEDFVIQHSTACNKRNYDSITDFLKDYALKNLNFKNVIIEKNKYDSEYMQNFAFPYMSFYQIFEYLNDYMLSEKKTHDYTAYTTLYLSHDDIKTINISSFSNLFKQKPAFPHRQVKRQETNYLSTYFYDFMLSTPNIEGSAARKGVGCFQRYFDYTNKELVTEEITFENTMAKEYALGKYSLYEKEFSSRNRHNSFVSQKNYSGENNIIYNTIKNTFGFVAEFSGMLERQIGIISDVYFIPTAMHGKNETNEALSGNYLVTRVEHNFSKSDYRQKVWFSRNALMTKNSTEQYQFTNTNISIQEVAKK